MKMLRKLKETMIVLVALMAMLIAAPLVVDAAEYCAMTITATQVDHAAVAYVYVTSNDNGALELVEMESGDSFHESQFAYDYEYYGDKSSYDGYVMFFVKPLEGYLLTNLTVGTTNASMFPIDSIVRSSNHSGYYRIGEVVALAKQEGYNPEGSHYSDEFITKYQKAQAARNDKLINKALERLDAINGGRGNYRDDEPWIVAGATQIAPCNRLFPQDIRLLSHTKAEWPLIHADGSITTGIIPSLRKARKAMPFTSIYGMGTMITSVKTYLSAQAVRTTEEFGYDETHIYGIDWDSTYCCTPGNMRGVKAPLLLMGMTGGYECLAAEMIYELAASEDKTLAFVEGASHMLWPAKECEQFPGQFGDTVKLTFEYAADWLGKHF